ncbi:MAG: hypothetical protein N2Z76_10110, partial [Treponemataceae bacterium]|nr:hypothetical protein [Treponemataceae bacterium]
MKRDKTFQGKDRERLRSVNPVTHFGFICLFILLYALSFARFNQEYKDLLPPGPFIQVRFVFFTAFVLVPFMFMSYLPLVIISTLGSYGSILFITMAIGADLSLLIPLSFPLLFALSLQLSYLQALFWIMVTNITIV